MENYRRLKELLNNRYDSIIDKYVTNPLINEMMKYSIENGKRLRPIIFCSSLKNLDTKSIELSLVLELFHTCSLVLDDLPCMDNDSERRGKTTFHIKYGERQALLFVSFTLNLCLIIIKNNIDSLDKQKKVLDEIYKNMGMLGACGGQFLDLCPIIEDINKQEFINKYSNKEGLIEILNLKTTTFFHMCFILAYIQNNDLFDVSNVKDISYSFGLLFQLYDDFDDIEQDYNRKKDGEFSPNFILSYGMSSSYELFKSNQAIFQKLYSRFFNENQVVAEILEYLENQVNTVFAKYNSGELLLN